MGGLQDVWRMFGILNRTRENWKNVSKYGPPTPQIIYDYPFNF